MDTLSRPRSTMRPRYDAVVVGSGYGGGVLACRLARAGMAVAVLERGREVHPGQFPSTAIGVLRDVQAHTERCHLGSRTGLFDFRFSDDVGVLIGCGLGGTSLINANVALEADPRVFQDACWPKAFRDDPDPALDAGLGRALEMLGSTPYPATAPPLPKQSAHCAAADRLGAEVVHPRLNVTFTAGPNAAGLEQAACTNCGDCVTGCNVGAKNTVLMNYLFDAVAHGAEVFTEITASSVLPAAGPGWRVEYRSTRGRRPAGAVEASIVVLAAGALGSTELLLRSRAEGLHVSPTLGRRMSGNADFLAFAYDCDGQIDGVGRGARADALRPVGPCITSAIDMRPGRPVAAGLVVEEGSIPSALAPLLPISLFLAALRGKGGRRGLRRRFRRAASRTQTFLAMGTDDDRGTMTLRRGRVVLSWPGAAGRPWMRDDDAILQGIANAMGGTYLRSPAWRSPMSDRYVTVHPLGGCDMADDAASGVVDDRGRVFSGDHGPAVYDGLYVADGSIVPTSLGANPSLTIAALAERIAELLLVAKEQSHGDR